MKKKELITPTIQSKILIIRSKQVMLDKDLARLYKVETKAFNQAVKRNSERFPKDFYFQLTSREYEFLRSQTVTSKTETRGGRQYCPYAFTEQGVAMLSAVLHSAKAVQVSIQIMEAFVEMRHYLAANANFINQFSAGTNLPSVSQDGFLQLTAQTCQNTRDIADLRTADIERQKDLKQVMDYFNDPGTYKHFKLEKGDPLGADLNYANIYALAQKNFILVDNYVSVKTLDLMRNIANGISITILSDQYGHERLTENILNDFRKSRPDLQITLLQANHTFHDRYIFVDYGLPYEKLFHSGASPKDAGKRVSTLMQIEKPELYHSDIDGMLKEK